MRRTTTEPAVQARLSYVASVGARGGGKRRRPPHAGDAAARTRVDRRSRQARRPMGPRRPHWPPAV